LVSLKSEPLIGFHGIEALILKRICANLIGEGNTSSFLSQAKQHTPSFDRDSSQGFIKLAATIATL
jgi:hypothetical protein